MYNVLDLFCGTGGFSYGFESAALGFKTCLGVDVLPVAGKTFQANHPDALMLTGDIRRLRRIEVSEKLKLKKGQIDVILGGPPCQGFSSIRPFRSSIEDDPRNSLFEEYASFVNYFRPTVFVLENVVGLATHRSGNTVESMEACFRSLGYETEWRILNAAHYGVPQKRERLIMIGAQKGIKIRFPNPTHSSCGATIGHKDRSRLHSPMQPNLFNAKAAALEKAVSVLEAISDLPAIAAGESAVGYRDVQNGYQLSRRGRSAQVSLHSATAHTPKMLEIIRHSGKNISSIPSHLISSGFSSCYSRLDGDEPAVTITVNFVHPASNRCIHPIQDRALTPREGARLQSFDDTFFFSGNRTQVVKQIGNAVPPLLGRAIAESVATML
ncbi:DNA cytosine methyltransferase [Granulicella sp. dw_53]|uniref:DNA cytosine methyltransferase n=1 Tax=Granulicella sp. dw_53 TaxID=2719792 RepID=UPI001BD528C2|nr:DNA cytosine methyltransferase [Granulicella sp. dw_53]